LLLIAFGPMAVSDVPALHGIKGLFPQPPAL
jgi:hypothetical protein